MTKRVDIRLDATHLEMVEDLKRHYKKTIKTDLTTTAIIKIAITAMWDARCREAEDEDEDL